MFFHEMICVIFLFNDMHRNFLPAQGFFWILHFQYEQDYVNIDFAKFAITCHFYTPISKNRHQLQQNCIWLLWG